jgi:hypothetical protein
MCDLINVVVSMEQKPVLDRLMAAGYAEVALMLLSDPRVGSNAVTSKILWQIGMLNMDDRTGCEYSTKFLSLDIVGLMLRKKE